MNLLKMEGCRDGNLLQIDLIFQRFQEETLKSNLHKFNISLIIVSLDQEFPSELCYNHETHL